MTHAIFRHYNLQLVQGQGPDFEASHLIGAVVIGHLELLVLLVLVVVFLFGARIRVQEIPAAGLEEAWNTELKSQKPPILKCQVRQRKRPTSRPINTLLFK